MPDDTTSLNLIQVFNPANILGSSAALKTHLNKARSEMSVTSTPPAFALHKNSALSRYGAHA